MIELRRRWNGFWFRADTALNLAVARLLLAGTSLWIVLSRPALPSILEFPDAMWQSVSHERRVRFLLIFSQSTEQILWYSLHVALVLCLLGIMSRWSALVSGLLLYHFAPLEAIFRGGNPNLFGFTIPCLALIVVAASASGGGFGHGEESWQHRWPVAIIEFLLCAMYFFAGYSKLFATGLAWLEPQNIRNTLLAINQTLGFTGPSLALWIAGHPTLCALLSVAGVGFELTFPAVMISRRARAVYVPVAIVFHLLNAIVFRIHFQDMALLLVFVDWRVLTTDRIMRR